QLQVSMLWLDEYKVSPCLACSRCPRESAGPDGYGCIQEDDMMELDQRLLESDGVAFVFDDTPGRKDFWPRFKVFTERTRHLRRNHFALSDRTMGFFQVGDIAGGSLALIKGVTYALRHNAIICGPPFVRLHTHGGEVVENTSLREVCKRLAARAWRRKFAVMKNHVGHYAYLPVGYKAG
ncbi:MAG: flavodoxin family protein, partial [Deltaproteobacteria bacterium]|nr:flavodoxin family protein [Deltaproteobacteria bacterium]